MYKKSVKTSAINLVYLYNFKPKTYLQLFDIGLLKILLSAKGTLIESLGISITNKDKF